MRENLKFVRAQIDVKRNNFLGMVAVSSWSLNPEIFDTTYSSYSILRAVGSTTSYHVLLGKPEAKSGICIEYPIADDDDDLSAFFILHTGAVEKASAEFKMIKIPHSAATSASDLKWFRIVPQDSNVSSFQFLML